jgi:transcriptional regulator with XRE-family HTH domain
MIDQVTNLEDGDLALPAASLDLSTRMRDLRARQGLKQSEVARRMRLDPSIPSLWEQGKRLVPANRVRALAEALEVSLEELLDGVVSSQQRTPTPSQTARTLPDTTSRGVIAELVDGSAIRPQPVDVAPVLHLPTLEEVQPVIDEAAIALAAEQWVVPERPPLDGWIPDGWQPTDRIQDISPSLPDGYWLDPIKLEKAPARQLLRSRLCAADRSIISNRDVPGAALVERLYRHCSKEDGFAPNGRLPVAETIFRCVVSADHGGLTDGALVEMLRERSGAVPVSATLLRRLRDSVRPYPIRRVDADLFGGRR